MKLLILAVFPFLAQLPAAAQISYSAWSATPLGTGCMGACNQCTPGFSDLGNTVQVSALSSTPAPGSFCSTGYEMTSTATVGPGAVRLLVTSDLNGTLMASNVGSSYCSASVLVQGSLLLTHGTTTVFFGNTAVVDDSREKPCLVLAPGTYTLSVRLEVTSDNQMLLPGGPSFADFSTAGPGLEVTFTDITPPPSQLATYFEANSCTFPNPDLLTAMPAVPNTAWTANLTLGIQRSSMGQWVLLFGTQAVVPCAGTPLGQFTGGLNFGTSKNGRMLLCNLNASGLSLSGVHSGNLNDVSSITFNVPVTLCLVGYEWCGQAIVVGPIPGAGNARLSSMIGGMVGF